MREMQVDVPVDATVADVLTTLERRYPRMKDYRPVVLTALNQEYVNQNTRVQEGDELAIFPPVSGGEVGSDVLTITRPGELYQITRDPIDAQKISQQMLRAEDGAICVFEEFFFPDGNDFLELVYGVVAGVEGGAAMR